MPMCFVIKTKENEIEIMVATEESIMVLEINL